MKLNKIIEQTLGVKTKHVRDEELYFSKKLMEEAVKEAFKDLNKRIGTIDDARDGFEEGYNQGVSDVRVSIKKVIEEIK